MVVECHICNTTIDGVEQGSYIVKNPYEPLDEKKYTLIKCPKCENPILTIQKLEYFAGILEFGVPSLLYPTGDFHINPSIPDKLQKALLESILCFRSGANTATVILCRRTIEGFCSLKETNEKNLAKSLKALNEKGIINEQLYEWANELRISGNEAAHNINSTFTSTDARDILDFTIAILDFTYSIQDKFDEFKKRRNNFLK